MGKQKKSLKELNKELDYWENYQPVNNMGKWARQVRVDSIKQKIENKKNKIKDDEDNDLHIDDLTNLSD